MSVCLKGQLVYTQRMNRYMQSPYVWAVAGVGIAGLAVMLWYINPQSSFVGAVPPAVLTTGCDETQWKFNAEQETVSEKCVYITGVVVRSSPEADGDYHIDITPDTPFVSLMNFHNRNEGGGTIGIEPICVVQPKKNETAFVKACNGFVSSVYIPTVGQHIGVLGAYAQDKHLWMEIHPATKITVLP